MQNSPLTKYFRQPGIHVRLPSDGNYNKPGEIIFTSSREVAIFPMTAADEIVLSNPDSLLNGAALERIILSCCPAITNIKELSVPDVDVIVLATKLVSYGDSLKLISNCEKCRTGTEFVLSIRNLLEQSKLLPKEHSVRLNDDLIAFLRPYTLESNNRLSLAQFEETKLIQNLVEDDVSQEQRTRAITEAFEKITNLNLELLASSVIKIVTPDTEVVDQTQIQDFITNVSHDIVKKLKDGVQEFNKYGLPKDTSIKCSNKKCQHEWTSPIVYDPSSFFGSDS